jgi:solute carrier family 7 (L-type amino acid transporter), member 9/15
VPTILCLATLSSRADTSSQTAITRLLGRGFGILAAVLICLVIAGSLLGNLFVASRMAVAAANRGWFPSLLAVTGGFRPSRRHQDASQDGENDSSNHVNGDTSDLKATFRSDAPIPALLLSSTLGVAYILLGNFRSLLTFNGLAEYSFFFLTVISAIVLRFREPDLARPYKPLLIVPITFAVVSGFVVVRGAVFAPILAAVLVGLWGGGLAWYFVRRRWFVTARRGD